MYFVSLYKYIICILYNYLINFKLLIFFFNSEPKINTIIKNGIKLDIGLSNNSFIENMESFNFNICHKSLRRVISWIYPGSTLKYDFDSENLSRDEEEFNPNLFYKSLSPTGNEPTLKLQPPFLNVKLRNYQSRAVQWMINRENHTNILNEYSNPMWKELKCKNISKLYYNEYDGLLSKSIQPITDNVKGGILADEMGLGKTIEVLSCILLNQNNNIEKETEEYFIKLNEKIQNQDNMNVDNKIIQCFCINGNDKSEKDIILCNICNTMQHSKCIGITKEDFNDKEQYLCPDCSFSSNIKLPSKTTLIICPNSILQQWRHEITERTSFSKGLKILIYKGISNTNRDIQLSSKKNEEKRIVLPKHLAEYDIVLTTFDILRGDLNHSELRRKKNSRNNRKIKYRSLPTPLIGLNWWRVCIDEAQMVSSGTAKAASMALKLESKYRWCISGTPIQRKGLEDLHGLLLFLQIPFLSDLSWFKKAIQLPMEFIEYKEDTFKKLVEYCRPFFWRSSKEDVKNELSIPQQIEKLHLLRLRPVESHYYKKQHQACFDATINVLTRSKQNRLTQKQLSSLLTSLLRLRQACCHPNIGNQSAGIHIQQTTLSMEQLLEQLILKAKIECEEAQRQWVCAGSGLAALKIIDSLKNNDYKNAIDATEYYKSMIKETNQNDNLFHLDTIQKIHLYHNLAALLGYIENDSAGKFKDIIREKIGYSLMDTSLIDTMNEMKIKYTDKTNQQVLSSKYILQNSINNLQNIMKNIDKISKKPPWWDKIFEEIKNPQNFIDKLRDMLIEERGDNYLNHPQCFAKKFYSISQLKFILKMEIQLIHQQREEILNLLKENEPSKDSIILREQVKQLIECTCKSNGLNQKETTCHSCNIFKKIAELEQKLVFDSTLSKNQDSIHADGLSRAKHDSDLYLILQYIIRLLPGLISNSSYIKEFIQEIKLDLDILKEFRKELKLMRLLWEAQRNHFLAFDEIEQAITRIRLRYPGEIILESEKHYKIQPFEIEQLRNKFEGEKNTAKMLLSQKKGQLKYLSNLGNSNDRNNEESECSEECVICREEIGDQLVVLACGHEFCGICITALVVRSHGTIKCPTCRTRMNSDEIAYISKLPSHEIHVEQNNKLSNEESNNNVIEKELDNNNNNNNDIIVVGSWGSKIEAVIRELLRIKKIDPKTKSIVFSQWNEVLDIIHQGLEKNNIPSVNLCNSNKKKQYTALNSYKFLSNISVLLLPLSKGANGLNLIEATHVFLVEPLLNPGVELQAIGRVHRIGQTKETIVHRFVVQNTIEEKLHQINSRRKEKHNEECSVDWKLKKSEKDCMTTSDLRELFGISQDENDDDIIEIEEEEPIRFTQPIADKFWNTKVEWDGGIYTRQEVAKKMETQHALRRLNSGIISTDRTCNLYSIILPNGIAKRIMNLKQVDLEKDTLEEIENNNIELDD